MEDGIPSFLVSKVKTALDVVIGLIAQTNTSSGSLFHQKTVV